MDFPIKVNDITIMSSEIFPFVRNYQTKKAIDYLIEKTGCTDEEALEVVNDLRELTLTHRSANRNDFNKKKEECTKEERIPQNNIPKCPTCGSTNIRKIGTGERAFSVFGLGILSRKINKTWQCNNCSHTW